MVSFSSNLREYTKMFKDAEYRFAPENMSDWFTPKKTRMQSCHEKRFFGFKKTAVVLIGVSACGKSTWAKKFLSTHPKFKYISFDECTFKASEEVGYADVDVSTRSLELVDQMFEANKKSNIVVDGLVVSVEKRAALMKTLNDMGYTIYVVYFTNEYNEKHMKHNIAYRSVDHVLFAKMVASDPEHFAFFMSLNLNMLEVYANKEGISVAEVVLKYCNDPMVVAEIKLNFINYEKERIGFDIAAQEEATAFMWGADYYYEVR